MAELPEAAREPGAWANLIDPVDPRFVAGSERLRTNLVQFETDFRPTGALIELSPERQALLGSTARAYAVRVRWAVPGEPAPAEHTVWFTVTRTRAGAQLAGTSDAPADNTSRPIWWINPVSTHHTDRAAVVSGPGIDHQSWLDALDNASTTLANHRISHPLLVAELPPTAAEFERILGVPQGSHRRIAASTWPFGRTTRIVVNPEVANALAPPARQVLIIHEAVHQALPPSPGAPLWLTEGYADLIALDDQPAIAQTHLDRLAADQRQHGAATALVTDAELAAADPRVQANYQRAWLAVRVLDRDNGTATRVHSAVASGTPLASALAAEGWTETTLAEAVHIELARLAR